MDKRISKCVTLQTLVIPPAQQATFNYSTVKANDITIQKVLNAYSFAFPNGNAARFTSTTTYYIRDAQGNVISTEEKVIDNRYVNNNAQNLSLFFDETHLYGSSRLGLKKQLAVSTVDFSTPRSLIRYTCGVNKGDKCLVYNNELIQTNFQ